MSQNPLLLSVRSGAKISMPGMMDTVLDLGLSHETLGGLADQTQNARFAFDAYRRFIQLFGKIVLGVDGNKFERALARIKGRRQDSDLTTADLIKLSETFKQIASSGHWSRFPLLVWSSRRRLPTPESYLRYTWHCCQRSGDGLRQYGR